MHTSEPLLDYLQDLLAATRNGHWFVQGLSPRAGIAVVRAAQAQALLSGRDYVAPDDVQAVFHNVLRHRLILSYEAEAEGVSTDQVLTELLKRVPVA